MAEEKVIVAPEEGTDLPDVNLDVQQQAPAKTADAGHTQQSPTQDDLSAELAAYKQRLLAESQARETAERQRNEAVKAAQDATTSVSDSQWHMLKSAVDARKADIESAKRDYVQAMEKGDWTAVADANARMAEHAAEKKQYESSLAQLEEWRKQPNRQQQTPVVQQQSPQIDVVEARARQSTPRAAEWIRRHPDVVRDPETWNRIVAAANYSTNVRRLAPDSPEWLAAIEADIGMQSQVSAQQLAAQQAQQRRGQVAAPPSRSATGQNGARSSGQRILTHKQAAAAADMGMTNEEYWTYLQECIADGSIDGPKELRH